MLTRRELLRRTAHLGAALALPPALVRAAEEPAGVLVNDVQSQLNATRVARIVKPDSLDALQAAIKDAGRGRKAISICGGRHAMGGQQFGADTVLIDLRSAGRVLSFDKEKGEIEVEAGIQWPELLDYLHREQADRPEQWTIRQKQTGVDRVTLAGSLAANIHGRQLKFPPIVSDVESLVLVDAAGKAHTCSRRENAELFSLAIGGYGLFGVIARVRLRLVPRVKVERVVKVIEVRDLPALVDARRKDGFLYGDCQYSTDLQTDSKTHAGVFSCYRPVDKNTPIPKEKKHLTEKDWLELYKLARTDKKKAFEKYSQYYLATSGQVYWSDTHQLSNNIDYYRESPDKERGTEMITEVYVSPDELLPFLREVRKDFLDNNVDLTYGTIRFIEKDNVTFLPWAREACVCVLCNLHVVHSEAGLKKAAEDFRRILDRVIAHGGRYYLTYHRWATRKQVETCYPRFVDFLRLKKKYDPEERFQSTWYRHYKTMFADKL